MVDATRPISNPFPGLRPFEPDEDHLFFGREKQIDELLDKLRSSRFLSVVGTSGSGKSSLIYSGLIPALHSGFMATAGSSWRVARLRPAEDSIGHLAAALEAPAALGAVEQPSRSNRILLEATLRRGGLGLVDAVRLAGIPAQDNLLVVVDQFEELFRFRRTHQRDSSKEEGVAFVKLLVEAAQQHEFSIYIVLSMRSDFIGDCMEYPGLSQAVTAGQYLVPRMSREELRSAITGPVAVAGGEITPRLVARLLNDLSDETDQLPVLQHALMRTWDHWAKHHQAGEPIDIADYEAVGTMRQALSLHAEEAYHETGSLRGQQIAKLMFKGLTDTFSDQRGVRRPTSVKELIDISQAPEEEVIEIIELFRRPGRTFLMPPAAVPINSRIIIDISHESLMRCWERLVLWAAEEKASAEEYARLSQAALWYEQGKAGLWRNPELEFGLQWRRENKPTAAWAARYNGTFAQAMEFLERSEEERNRLETDQERERKKRLRHWQRVSAAFAISFVVATAFLVWALTEKRRADANQAQAVGNLQLAQDAVTKMLSPVDSEEARETAEVPQMEDIRRELLDNAKGFYSIFTQKQPNTEQFRYEIAMGHFGLGAISLRLDDYNTAASEYKEAITELKNLADKNPANPEYREELANSYNFSAETLRMSNENPSAEAGMAYSEALRLQNNLVRDDPGNGKYKQDLARTYYNRGIFLYSSRQYKDSEADFNIAIRLLQPLAETKKNLDSPSPSEELARSYNNLANLLRTEGHWTSSRTAYDKAITIDEGLAKDQPGNRDYKLELAKFLNNRALLLQDQQEFAAAKVDNTRALRLIGDLARPAPSLDLELANAHDIRGLILESQDVATAESEYHESMGILKILEQLPGYGDLPEFHNLAGDLVSNFLQLANTSLQSESLREAQRALQDAAGLLPDVPAKVRDDLTRSYEKLLQSLQVNRAEKR